MAENIPRLHAHVLCEFGPWLYGQSNEAKNAEFQKCA